MTTCTSHNNKYSDLFDGMHQYMFSAENLIRLRGADYARKPVEMQGRDAGKNFRNKVDKRRVETTFQPRQHDTMFWCFFIILRGFDAYELVKTTPFKTEKEFKISSVELLRQNADQLKTLKLKLGDIENELVNESKITLSGLRALCLVHKVSIFYVSGRTYCEFYHATESSEEGISNEISVEYNSSGTIVYDKSDNKSSIRYENKDDYKDKIKKSCWCIENPQKPMKAISGYTLAELQAICVRLGVQTIRTDGKKENKKALYEAIMSNV